MNQPDLKQDAADTLAKIVENARGANDEILLKIAQRAQEVPVSKAEFLRQLHMHETLDRMASQPEIGGRVHKKEPEQHKRGDLKDAMETLSTLSRVDVSQAQRYAEAGDSEVLYAGYIAGLLRYAQALKAAKPATESLQPLVEFVDRHKEALQAAVDTHIEGKDVSHRA